MHSPVTAIRAGRPRPQFVAPPPRTRGRQLGLVHRSRIVAALPHRRCSALHPRAAVRSAARSPVRPRARRAMHAGLRGAAQVSWTRRELGGLRVAHVGRAAAWRV